MALSSYTELKASIADWLVRTDLTAVIDDFIDLTEAEIKRRLEGPNVVREPITLAAAVVNLPATVSQVRSLRMDMSSDQAKIEVVSYEMLTDRRVEYGSAAGRPRFAASLDGQLLLVPTPDQSYTAEIVYYDLITSLDGSNPSNSVLVLAPDAYLFGALMQAAPYLENDARIPTWEGKFEKAITQLEIARERAEFGAGNRPVRLPVVFG